MKEEEAGTGSERGVMGATSAGSHDLAKTARQKSGKTCCIVPTVRVINVACG